MLNKRKLNLRLRRVFRKKQRQAEDITIQTEEGFDKLVIRRLNRLTNVWRFVISWTMLVLLLCFVVIAQTRQVQTMFLSLQPTSGGSYSEGVVGGYTNANPIYATDTADSTISRLLFSSLLTYDSSNKLVGDLAESWSVDDTDTVYSVKLRPSLKWHDGKDITADDVVFTFDQIKNPDVKSPLFQSWHKTKVTKLDDLTVTFTLPAPFSPFIQGLTTGIIPKHVLVDTPASQLRSALFNTTKPVGSGPFVWSALQTTGATLEETWQQISLKPYAGYHKGSPKLDEFIVKTYPSEDKLIDAYEAKEVDALVDIESIPEEVSKSSDTQIYQPTLTAEVLAFLRSDSDILNNVQVRRALTQSVNIKSVVENLDSPVTIARGPFLASQNEFSNDISQLPFDIDAANKLLDESGWVRPADGGTRQKSDGKLKLTVVAKDSKDQIDVLESLRGAWQKVGVEIESVTLKGTELQDRINSRNYDVLLYGIAIGQDPDVFAYWHSSQFDPRSNPRFNFSNYKSKQADDALVAGRSRTDKALRAAKYKLFLEAWRGDAPAVALYQPRLIYAAPKSLVGFDAETVNSAADRLANVHNWTINKSLQPKK
ncbi:peptide ABC transporter substrate-binding protein [Candidatus Saccharibacteria bacterium]|jgi:peptide/nickel transport system substrate-binding protein|nr:peptide ABC transporter substrate-binding protein [Candidatus Saccharibacteria bacterium]